MPHIELPGIDEMIPGLPRHIPGDPIESYIQEARKYKLLTKAEEQHLGHLAIHNLRGAKAARRKLVQSNLRLVIHVVRRFQNRGLTIADLIQEGNLGLMHAVRKFDPARGCRFSTYAIWWIQQAVRRALTDTARVVRVPVNALDWASKAKKVAEAIRQHAQREPDISEVSQVMKKKAERMTDVLRGAAGIHPVSLDRGAGGGNEDSQRTISRAALLVAPEEQVPALDRKEIRRILTALNPVEQLILTRRYGLDGRPATTLQGLAKRLGISRERVRQLQSRALAHLRSNRYRLLGTIIG
jgi:RNA polymerase sigma factor (sigma-70 family)